MAITNASRLADWGSGIGTEGAVLQVDNANDRLGVGTTNPQGMLQVGTSITMHGNAGNIISSGIITATTFSGSGSGLTGSPNITINNLVGVAATFTGVLSYEDVTNVDSFGIVTAGGGLYVGRTSIGATFTTAGDAILAGVVTATSFSGDGSGLSGVESWNQQDTWLYGGG